MLEITFGRVPSIFKDNLNMHQTATKFMLHLLNEIHTITSTLNRTFNRGPKETLNSFQTQSQVMRHRFTGTTQKPSKTCLSGRAHYLHVQKTQDMFAQMKEENHCFSTLPLSPPHQNAQSCTMNFFHKYKV